jgi:hypothetical protein
MTAFAASEGDGDMYDPAAFADKIEKVEAEFWEALDSWLADMLYEGQVDLVGTTLVNALRTVGATGSKVLTGTVADLLRLGTFDPDDTSAWGITKGIGANALRVISVVGPAGKALGWAARYAGLAAVTKLKDIPAVTGPCTYVAANNAVSLLRGQTKQIFASVDDIVAAGGSPAGAFRIDVANMTPVKNAMDAAGIYVKRVFGANSIDDAINVARKGEGPVSFSVQWTQSNGQTAGHALTAMKDPWGRVKILDYFENQAKGFKGYDSIDDFEKAWNLAKGAVRYKPEGGHVLQYSSQYMQLLKLMDGAFVVAIPFVAGVRPKSQLFDAVQSVWEYFKRKLGDDSPPLPDLETNETKWTVTIPGKPPYWYTVRQGIPREDWLSVRAEKHYGDMLLWPLILEATQAEERKTGAVSFVNQNKLWVGQKIFVPDIAAISPEKKAAARTRGRDWKRVG